MWYFRVKFEGLLIDDQVAGKYYNLDADWVFWGYYSRRALLTVHDRFKAALSGHCAVVSIVQGHPPHRPPLDMQLYYKDSAKIPDLYRLLQNIVH